TDCRFTVDGEHAGSFNHSPSDSTELEYNVLVYSATGLSQTTHSMVFGTSGYDVFINFDYAIY
ncbi:hypothetical protein BDZ89DRAFT_908005, partial [Hymenopellis radicata]